MSTSRPDIVTPRPGFLRLALTFALVLLALQFSFMCAVVHGTSMSPTLRNGQWTLVSNLPYVFASPKRGDLVLVSTGKEYLVKRIIGLPGETVTIRNSLALVNGKPLPEYYVKSGGHWEVAEGRIDPGKYVIIGDNRAGRLEESLLAVVKRDRIVGKVICF